MPKNMIDDMTSKVKKAIKTLKKKKTVLFVCTGNTCRSAMAEMIFKSYLKEKELLDLYSVESAGLSVSMSETDMNMLAKEALTKLEIKYTRHIATQLDIMAVTNAYSVICMEQAHKDMIIRAVGDQPKIKTINEITNKGDIPDPYGPDFAKYTETAKTLISSCDKILETLEPPKQDPQQEEPSQEEPNQEQSQQEKNSPKRKSKNPNKFSKKQSKNNKTEDTAE